MFPGTTPTHIFKDFPFSSSEVAALRITYEQSGKTVLQKTKDDCTISDGCLTVKLTQKDSLQFASNVNVRIQIKLRTVGGDVAISNLMNKPVKIVLDKEEI